MLPADARRRGGALRPRPVRRGHPEHPSHHPWRGVQLLADRVVGVRERTACRLREDGTVYISVGLRHPCRRVARHSRHQRHGIHHGAAEHQHPGPDRDFRRTGVPAGEPEAVPLADRRCAGLVERAPSIEVRIPARRPVPVAVHQYGHARHDQLRPELHEQSSDQRRRLGHRLAPHRLYQQRGTRLPARTVHTAHAGACAVRAGRRQGERAVHRQCRPSIRNLRRGDRREQQDRQLRSGEPPPDLRGRGRRQRVGQQKDALRELRAAIGVDTRPLR